LGGGGRGNILATNYLTASNLFKFCTAKRWYENDYEWNVWNHLNGQAKGLGQNGCVMI